MELENKAAFDIFQDERVIIGSNPEPVYAIVVQAGDPVSGGALTARQDGDQYTLRFKKTEYASPAVHDTLKTTNYGTLKMKQRFSEGEYWSCLCTGSVRGGRGR